MADINVENMEENAQLFEEKMGFPHTAEGLELTDDQLVNFLLLCYQGMVLPDEEEEMEMEEEHMDGDVKVKNVIMPGKYSPKQMKIAKIAKPKNKLTGADFKKLAKNKKKSKTKKA